MTFDEAIEVLANSENNKLVKEGQLEYGLYRAYDVVSVLQKLRQEYAPTIEMTKEQYDYISPLIQQGKELGATFTEFWEVYKFTGASKKIHRTFNNQEQAMQVWLHPETIKVVDE